MKFSQAKILKLLLIFLSLKINIRKFVLFTQTFLFFLFSAWYFSLKRGALLESAFFTTFLPHVSPLFTRNLRSDARPLRFGCASSLCGVPEGDRFSSPSAKAAKGKNAKGKKVIILSWRAGSRCCCSCRRACR